MSTATLSAVPYPSATRRDLPNPQLSSGKIHQIIHLENGILASISTQVLWDICARFLSQQPTELDFLEFALAMKLYYPGVLSVELRTALIEVAYGRATMQGQSLIVAGINLVTDALQKRVRMNDAIRLKARNDMAEHPIARFGQWWKVVNAMVRQGQQEQWLIRSMTKAEQGSRFAGTVKFTDSRYILKLNDPDFEIIDLCPFPEPIDPKKYDK